jgi:pimeloyl-ACP methyl ester carboxylesterase
MVVLPVGHATAAEAPDEFNRAVMEFLTECEERNQY